MGEYKEKMFTELLENREIMINGDIEEDLIEKVVMNIFKFNQKDDKKEKESKTYNRKDNPIKIYIHTRGGNTLDCSSVVSAILSSKTPVYTYALGKVFSAGFYIFVAGHKRFCQKYSLFLYHGTAMSSGYTSLVKIKDIADAYSVLENDLNRMVENRTKISKGYLEKIKHREWFITSKEALDLGIVHKII